MIMVDDTQLEIPHLAAERVAKNDKLNDREDERHDDQRRTPAKPSQFPLEDGHGSMHIVCHHRGTETQRFMSLCLCGYLLRIINELSMGDASCSASRNWRPV